MNLYKEHLWGGNLLKTDYGKDDVPDICAENWELSNHKDGKVFFDNSMTIDGLIKIDSIGYFGKDYTKEYFPIIVN